MIELDILKARILIVDDQPVNVQLLEQLLSQAGYTSVSSTMQPKEVGPLHEAHPYDLILLDLKMPGMDGFQVMEGLKANIRPATTAEDHHQGQLPTYLPVIVLTAEPGHKLRALNAGARDFISKPFDLIEVKTRIHHMLEVRLLYKKIAEQNRLLQETLKERTAKLLLSEDRLLG
jgi:CheY-like chemotaxis protein